MYILLKKKQMYNTVPVIVQCTYYHYRVMCDNHLNNVFLCYLKTLQYFKKRYETLMFVKREL